MHFCVINFGKKLGEICSSGTYNNSYHASMKMSPFEALYDRNMVEGVEYLHVV